MFVKLDEAIINTDQISSIVIKKDIDLEKFEKSGDFETKEHLVISLKDGNKFGVENTTLDEIWTYLKK